MAIQNVIITVVLIDRERNKIFCSLNGHIAILLQGRLFIHIVFNKGFSLNFDSVNVVNWGFQAQSTPRIFIRLQDHTAVGLFAVAKM